jgi:hypothetical protein
VFAGHAVRLYAATCQATVWVSELRGGGTVVFQGLSRSISQGLSRSISRGNAVTRGILAAPVRRAVQRSRPMAKPPWGGMP